MTRMLVVLFFALTASVRVPAQSESSDVRGADAIAQALVDARDVPAPVTELAARLASGGLEAIEPLFTTLVRGRFDVEVGERGNSVWVVAAREREALIAAFGRISWSGVRAFLETLDRDTAGDATRLAVLEIFGAHGSRHDLAALLAWSAPAAGSRRAARSIGERFGVAFEALLEREFVSAYELADLYEAAHLSLVPTLLSRVGARSSDENAAALGAMLGVLPEADVLVLTELAQMGKTVRHPLDAHVLERTRSYLWKQDPSLLVAAILAVDRMGDGAAVPTLADLLEHEHPNVRKHAHAALTTITREHLGHQREVWSDWYKSEQRWWRQQAPALIGEVRDRRHGVASRALLELSRHRLFRHELVDPVAHGLTHAEPEVVILACATLGHLGSPQSIRPLAVMLDEHGLEIRRAALLALRRLTGADHGEESDGWLATLDGAR